MRRTLLCICILLSLNGPRPSAGQAGSQPTVGDHSSTGIERSGWTLGKLFSPFKLSSALRAELVDGAETTFIVLMAEQADLSHVAALSTKEAQGHAVYDALREVARRTQAPLRVELERLGVEYRPYYIANMVAVRGDAHLALTLAARPDVIRLEANPAIHADLPTTELSQSLSPTQPTTVEWGVRKVNADDVWALGYTGEGIIIAGQDTGYDWDHPALKTQYRGWNGTTVVHDYNWHDAIHSGGGVCGADSPEPCDDYSHGTHTMGTILGDDGGSNQIGVAPGARWIGCRNMDQGVGTPLTYAECFEFFLAPYPIGGDPMTDGNPDLAPHIVNNSWSCPPSEGCNITSLRAAVENLRAAGIVVTVSAGNSGSGCESVKDPPALHEASFTVGATDSSDQIAGFSGRGPVTADGSDRLKPDVSAPGVGVRSSLPGGGYGLKSGTSMAAPHVSGLIALLWSAAPHLVGNVDLTEKIIRQTARPIIDMSCGGDADGHPNNVYGWGIMDALSAVQFLDLGVSVTAEPRWVLAGDLITYTFTVSHTGALGQATGVVLSDTLPLSTTFGQASGYYNRTAEEVVWNLGTISPSQQVSTTLVVLVDDTVPSGTLISNLDYQVSSNELLAPVTGPPAVVSVLREAVPVELAISLNAKPQQVQAGKRVSYTFVVSNIVTAPATGVILSDALPLDTAFAWASGSYSRTAQYVIWDLDTLLPGEQVSASLAVTVESTLPSGTQIANTDYQVRSNEILTPVTGPPAVVTVYREENPVRLTISVDAWPQHVQAGGLVSFTFAVSNPSTTPATGVVLSDVVPLGTTFAWADGVYNHAPRQVAWDLGTVSPTQQVSTTLIVTVESTLPSGTQISNVDYQVRSNEILTPITGPPAVVTVYRAEDPVNLAISMGVEPKWVRAGEILSFTFTVSNVVTAPAAGVILSDVLPLGTTFARATGDYTNIGREVIWNLDTIDPHHWARVTLAVTVGITLPSGTVILNTDYGVRSNQAGTLVFKSAEEALIPWEFFVPVILKDEVHPTG